MKKIFTLAAAVIAALSVSADVQVKDLSELGVNYVDFSTEAITSSTTVPTSVESTWFTTSNGAVCKGFLKSDGSEASNSWNVKEGYQNTFLIAEADAANIGLATGDSVKSGSVFRAASGSSISLGAFDVTSAGKLYVFWQPNGTSSRGVKISFLGDAVVTDAREFSNKNFECVTVYNLTKTSYTADEIVVAATGNTINIQGIKIDNLGKAAGLNEIEEGVKAQKFIENGKLVIMKNGVKYNAAGAIMK